jgi:DNA-binding NtrC family response regulator
MKNTVLVVDDDELIRKTVKRVLESAGIEVQTAESGPMCLDIMSQGFEGLVLMDVVMPEMSGWDTITAMVEKGYAEGNIICMFTGKEVPDERMEHVKEYVLDYIRKPFNNEKLIALIKEYLSYL